MKHKQNFFQVKGCLKYKDQERTIPPRSLNSSHRLEEELQPRIKLKAVRLSETSQTEQSRIAASHTESHRIGDSYITGAPKRAACRIKAQFHRFPERPVQIVDSCEHLPCHQIKMAEMLRPNQSIRANLREKQLLRVSQHRGGNLQENRTRGCNLVKPRRRVSLEGRQR